MCNPPNIHIPRICKIHHNHLSIANSYIYSISYEILFTCLSSQYKHTSSPRHTSIAYPPRAYKQHTTPIGHTSIIYSQPGTQISNIPNWAHKHTDKHTCFQSHIISLESVITFHSVLECLFMLDHLHNPNDFDPSIYICTFKFVWLKSIIHISLLYLLNTLYNKHSHILLNKISLLNLEKYILRSNSHSNEILV